MRKPLTLGIMGPGRAGKDEAAEWLVEHTTLTYGGTTSIAISREVARREGISFLEAHAQRHDRRAYWRALGDEMRAHNPSALAEEMLKDSTLLVGVRARIEMQSVIEKRLCDLIIWVDRPGIPHDPTLEFGPELCDFTINNWWDVKEYHRRWQNLATTLGVMKSNGMVGHNIPDGGHTSRDYDRTLEWGGDRIATGGDGPTGRVVNRDYDDGTTALGRAIDAARGGPAPTPPQRFA
jgi:hypothetical protein